MYISRIIDRKFYLNRYWGYRFGGVEGKGTEERPAGCEGAVWV